MECTRFEELLFERLEGLLDETRCAELAAHADTCPRCRALEVLLTSPAEATSAGSAAIPDDLTSSILALTSDRDPLLRALRQLDLDLPAMASMVPDENFVVDVMAATVEVDKQRFVYRLREFWHALAQRPRFALEGAYLGSLAIFLLVGLPGSPLAGVSDQVLNELRNEDSVVRTALSESASRVSQLGQATRARAGRLSDTLANRLPRAATLTHSTSWLAETAETLGDWWRDTFSVAVEWLRTAWLNTVRPAPDTSSTEAANADKDRLHV